MRRRGTSLHAALITLLLSAGLGGVTLPLPSPSGGGDAQTERIAAGGDVPAIALGPNRPATPHAWSTPGAFVPNDDIDTLTAAGGVRVPHLASRPCQPAGSTLRPAGARAPPRV